MHFYNVGYTESGLYVEGGVSWILDGSCMDWKEDAGLKMHLFIHLIPHLVGSLFWRALFLPFFWFAVHLFLFLSICLVQGGQTSRWGKALKVDLRKEGM
jgi:hypothetical protein